MASRIRKELFARGACLALLLGAGGSIAWAQETAGESSESSGDDVARMNTVVVSARKRDEQITDVPETIAAFSGEMLDEQGIRNLDDLGRSVPNVLLNRRGDNEPNVVIRGIGAFGNVQGIGYYIDDVANYTDQSARLVDLERVEVLKGPQGTLYGGNAIGGAVKFVTRAPQDAFEAKASVEAGEYETLNFNGSLNVPLGDTVFARVSAYMDTTDGFSKNPVTGKNNDQSEEVGIRAALRFRPSEATDVTATFRYSDLDNGGNDYYTTNAVDDYRYSSPLNEDIFNKRKVYGGILNVQHDFEGVSFTSISSYTQRKNRILWDLDYGPLDGVIASQRKPVESEVTTQEFRLASDNDGAFSWLVGLYGSEVTNRLLVIEADVTIGADFNEGVPLVIEDFNNGATTDTNYAAFGTLTYEFGKFELSAGARLNYNKFEGANRNIGQSASFDDTTVLPKVSLSYEPNSDVMFYGLVAAGYEPGKVNALSDSLASFDPETTTNYEIGVKGQLGGAFSYEAAAFYINNKDRQFETLVLNADNVPVEVTDNIGDSTSFGVEGGFSYRPTEELTIALGGGYLDAEYDNAVYLLQNYDGNSVPYSPRFTGNASVAYETTLQNGYGINLRADASRGGAFYWDIPNNARQEAYTIFGARAALSSPKDRWEFAISAQNLFDEGYHQEFLYNFAGAGSDELVNGVCDNCHLARVGYPRKVLATLTYRY